MEMDGIDTGGRCGTVGTGTCSDGIKNGNETGIDTGGRCDIGTGTCSDGIQNGNETGIDTGTDVISALALAPTESKWQRNGH